MSVYILILDHTPLNLSFYLVDPLLKMHDILPNPLLWRLFRLRPLGFASPFSQYELHSLSLWRAVYIPYLIESSHKILLGGLDIV